MYQMVSKRDMSRLQGSACRRIIGCYSGARQIWFLDHGNLLEKVAVHGRNSETFKLMQTKLAMLSEGIIILRV